jgi:hypothetical protein
MRSVRMHKIFPAIGLLALTATNATASPFTSFAEDENTCRQAASAAIHNAAGPQAAQRYDIAHYRCMVAHGRMRQIDAARNAAPDPQPANPHSFDFPDAYYSVPYATPGYGYDGFSY